MRTKRQAATEAKADKYFREQTERLGENGDGKGSDKGDGAGKGIGKGDGAGAPETEPAAVFSPGPAAVDPAALEEEQKAVQKDALERMAADGVLDPFIALAAKDPGFPFEPSALGALNILAFQKGPDFQRLRARLKAETKVSVSALESAMKAAVLAAGAGTGSDGLPGRAISYAAIAPWDEPVDGAELLTGLAARSGPM
jgi:hypothetical protein